MRGKWLIVLLGLLFSLEVSAQHIGPDERLKITEWVENLQDNSDDAPDPSWLIDHLIEQAENPLDINQLTVEKLENLGILSDVEIEALLSYVSRFRPVSSIYELAYVPGFDTEKAQWLSLFMQVVWPPEGSEHKQAIGRYPKQKLLWRTQSTLPVAEGYNEPDAAYPGLPIRNYLRYEMRASRLKAGFVLENDAGEPYAQQGTLALADYQSAYLQIEGTGVLNRWILGDFQAQFGQGLLMWSGFAISKSDVAIGLRRQARGISKYSSTDENRFMRGTAVALGGTHWKAYAFVSDHTRDASTELNEFGEPEISSLPETGLHRTSSELERKDAVHERLAGLHLEHEFGALKLGASAIAWQYSLPFAPKTELYRALNATPQEGIAASTDYYWHWRGMRLFGETALSASGVLATLNAMDLSLNKHLSISVLHRYYPANYVAPFAGAFGEQSGTNNEEGLYLGFEFRPRAYWLLTLYADAFRFPWLRYNTDLPGSGYEYLLKVAYTPRAHWQWSARAKYEVKELNESGVDQGLPELYTAKRWYLRTELKFRLSPELSAQTRVHISGYSASENEFGWMTFIDAAYKPHGKSYSVAGRVALYQTTYNTRIYAYENDLLYAFSVPAMSGHGMRAYLVAEADLSPRFNLGLRWAYNYQPSQTEWGSGNDLIPGATKHELKCQLRWSW